MAARSGINGDAVFSKTKPMPARALPVTTPIPTIGGGHDGTTEIDPLLRPVGSNRHSHGATRERTGELDPSQQQYPISDWSGDVHAERDHLACEQYAREALALMRDIGSVKGILQAGFKLAQATLFKGDLEDVRALVEQLRDLAEETNNLDGKTVATGLLAFLVSVKVAISEALA